MKEDKKMKFMDAEVVAAIPPEPFKPTEVRPTTNENHAMTFRMSMETADLLVEIAKDRRTKVQDIVALALDEWLRRNNLGSFVYHKTVKASKKKSGKQAQQ